MVPSGPLNVSTSAKIGHFDALRNELIGIRGRPLVARFGDDSRFGIGSDMPCSRQQSCVTMQIMSEWCELTRTLDSCYTLFLQDISEPQDNVLRLILIEGKRNPEPESQQIAGVKFENLHRIEASGDSRRFELMWTRYIAYNVTNESFGKPVAAEMPDSGRLLRRYSGSDFLDYVARSTIATDEYPGPQTHIRVLSENHVVDVVSTELPTLRVLNPDC